MWYQMSKDNNNNNRNNRTIPIILLLVLVICFRGADTARCIVKTGTQERRQRKM